MVLLLPLNLLAARVTAQGGGAGYSKLLQTTPKRTKLLATALLPALLQNACWHTKLLATALLPTRHAGFAGA